jgi:hypothetical protein
MIVSSFIYMSSTRVPLVPIRILVNVGADAPLHYFARIIGNSGKEYDRAIFDAPSWVVLLEKNTNQYPEEVQNLFDASSFLNQSNVIIIRKNSSLEIDHIEIADEKDLAFLDQKGGTKKRSKRNSERKKPKRNTKTKTKRRSFKRRKTRN